MRNPQITFFATLDMCGTHSRGLLIRAALNTPSRGTYSLAYCFHPLVCFKSVVLVVAEVGMIEVETAIMQIPPRVNINSLLLLVLRGT